MLTITNPKTFDWSSISLHDCAEGNAYDSYFTLKLYHLLEGKLENLRMMGVIDKLISPSLSLFSKMEFKGVDTSESELKKVEHELRLTNINLEDSMYSFDFVQLSDNFSSTKDLSEILYTREGALELYPPGRTATGSPSTDAATLKILLQHIEEELANRGLQSK